MAYNCVRGKGECDGCGSCMDAPEVIGKCYCGEDILSNEDYYDIDGELIHEDCLREWAEQFRAV